MDIAGIATTISATAAAIDGTVKTLKSVVDLTGKKAETGEGSGSPLPQDLERDLVNETFALLEMKSSLLEAQGAISQAHAELAERDKALGEKERAFHDFKSKAKTLRLVSVSHHSHAYVSVDGTGYPDNDPAERSRYYCQPCYDNSKISLLQFVRREPSAYVLNCPKCAQEIFVPADPGPSSTTARVKPGWSFFDGT